MDVPGIEKLIEVTANGIGSVAGRMFVEWKARKAGQARVIAAEAEARVLQIRARAHREARELLARSGRATAGDVDIGETISERVRYREQTRLSNIGAAVSHAAAVLEDKAVGGNEVDHDWTARFFNDVQDVSSEEMHVLWGRILAGEVERPGATSLRTLGVLRDLDQATAKLFVRFCSCSVFAIAARGEMVDVRVSSLGRDVRLNDLAEFGFGFPDLNRLHEHGLVIPDYNSWAGYDWAVVPSLSHEPLPSFRHQGREWALVSGPDYRPEGPLKIEGVALTVSGHELSRVVDLGPMPRYLEDLKRFFQALKLDMRDVTDLV